MESVSTSAGCALGCNTCAVCLTCARRRAREAAREAANRKAALGAHIVRYKSFNSLQAVRLDA